MNQDQKQTTGAVEKSSDSPTRDFIGYKVRMAQILAFRGFEGQLSRYGRAPRYLGLLAAIRSNPGLSQTRLAEAVALGRSSLVNILDQLEGDALLVRKPSATDRRRNGVWLTEKGRQVVTALLREAEIEDQRMTRNLSADEVTALRSLLDKVIHNLGG